MRGLALYAGFVIFSTVCAVLIGESIESYTSPDIGSIVMLVVFFVGLVVSWIATVFVMDGSLKNFKAEKEQLEAEKKGREYMARNM
jgi:Co/Zn/Cd efflux system component